jgi:iron complex outermembrane receptor protein
VLSVISASGLSGIAAAAEPAATTSSVTITGVRDTTDFVAPEQTESTVTRVGRGALESAADPAGTNPLKAIQLAPSVNFESADATGTTLNQTIRIRGKSSFHLSRTIEGLPITGIVGGADLVDMDNVEAVSVYRGALPANRGFGISNTSGVVDIELRRPQDRAAFDASLTGGTDSYRRVFARFDSGTLGTGTALFLSGASADGDKWRGKGENSRDNATLGLKQVFGDVELDVFAIYNSYKQNDYRALTYAQASNLRAFDAFDYNTDRTGLATNDINYYGFNRQEYNDIAVLSTVTAPVGEGTLSVKPYYWNDDGFRLFGGGNVLGSPGITRWDIQHDSFGFSSEYAFKLAGVDWAAGYWFQSMEAPPPPVYRKGYRIQANGDLTFAGWDVLSRQDRHVMNSPYLNASGSGGAFRWNAGARYLRQRAPGITYFLTAGLPDTTYDKVLDLSPPVDVGNSAVRRTLTAWLPEAGVTYELTPEWSVRGSIGRTHGRPDWGPQATQFGNNRQAFQAAGVTLQSLFDKLDMELATTTELGVRYSGSRWYIAPTLFRTKASNREVQIYDPVVRVAYYQSNTHTTAQGAELEVGATPTPSLALYGSVSYNRQRFDENTVVNSTTTVATRGKQVPDAPEWTAKIAASYVIGPVLISPSVRYLSTRYGDPLNAQPIQGATIADLEIGAGPWRLAGASTVRFAVSALNLFNKRYIALINASDIQANGATTYMPGAERAVAATLSFQY